ncbi:hypothetical protein QQP08_005645 [Theobroma cacao]|nr:hypothetical protein QQP08_005645 [Theobroma cacao]
MKEVALCFVSGNCPQTSSFQLPFVDVENYRNFRVMEMGSLHCQTPPADSKDEKDIQKYWFNLKKYKGNQKAA